MIAKEVMQEDVMSKYRLSVIDDAGHVVDLYEPECVSDEEAMDVFIPRPTSWGECADP